MSESAITSRSLPQIVIDTPCRMDWSDMKGNEQVRFCGRCEKSVYNFASMSESDAVDLLESEERVCARIFRRTDGTIVTNACPTPKPPAIKRRFQFSLSALVILLTASAPVCAAAPWIGKKIQPLIDRLTGIQDIAPPSFRPMTGEAMPTPHLVPPNANPEAEMGGASLPPLKVADPL